MAKIANIRGPAKSNNSVNLHEIHTNSNNNRHSIYNNNTNNNYYNNANAGGHLNGTTAGNTANTNTNNTGTKVVTFIKNGDSNYKKTIQISGSRYNRFDDLLKELDKALALPHGARHVYSAASGEEVTHINQLDNGLIYVCAGFEKFKPPKGSGMMSSRNVMPSIQVQSSDNYMSGSQVASNSHAGKWFWGAIPNFAENFFSRFFDKNHAKSDNSADIKCLCPRQKTKRKICLNETKTAFNRKNK